MPLLFETEAERLQHPQGKLIPLSLWSDSSLFDSSLNDSNAELIRCFKQALPVLNTEELKKSAWLAIVKSHPKLDFSTLELMASEFDFNTQDKFQLLAIHGDISHLTTFINEQLYLDPLDLIKDKDFSAYLYAAKNGNLEVIKYLESLAPKQIQSMIAGIPKTFEVEFEDGLGQVFNKSPDFYPFYWAAKNNHLDLCNHLLSQSSACIAYAAMRKIEYDHMLRPFCQKMAEDLYQESIATYSEQHILLDLPDPEQANIYFNILGLLLSYEQNKFLTGAEQKYQPYTVNLMNIPAIKALAEPEVFEFSDDSYDEIAELRDSTSEDEINIFQFSQNQSELDIKANLRQIHIQNRENPRQTQGFFSTNNSAKKENSGYPCWLIALFCIPVIGQLGFLVFKLFEYCFADIDENNDERLYEGEVTISV
jgi:hypothetical protein